MLRLWQRLKSGPGITILYGHRVMSDEIIANPSDVRRITGHTSESEVEAAIKQLSKRYRLISMDDAVEQIKNGVIARESAVLTFDDGFRDNFKYLYPILKKYKVPATYYINASVIGSNRNLWFQSIINYFFAVEGEEVFVEINQTKYCLETPSKRYQAAFDFMQYLQANHQPEEFLNIIDATAGDLCLPGEEDFHMSWDELEALVADPLITIGAHSYNHYPLGYCSEELSAYEIEKSVTELEKNLGFKIEHFSYPRGHKEDFNAHHISCLRGLNVSSGVTTIRGVNRRGEDIYQLKRVGFPQNISGDVNDFLWHVGGIPQIIENIKSK